LSNPSIVLAWIEELVPTLASAVFKRVTDDAIAALPERDEHPPLSRKMVSITGADHFEGSCGGRRLIVVAGTSNHLEDDVSTWLDKFEGFLRTFSWSVANVTLNMGYHGTIGLCYRADRSGTDPGQPTRSWAVTGYRMFNGPMDTDLMAMVQSRPGWREFREVGPDVQIHLPHPPMPPLQQ
jgi:hypothetical protein